MARYHESKRREEEMEMEHKGREHANMPTEVMVKDWSSSARDMMDGDLDDGMTGIDRQLSEDASARSRYMSPKKV